MRPFNPKIIQVDSAILQEASRIKAELQITDNLYHPKGVGVNDLLIVATAKILRVALVSNEGEQLNDPDIPKKRKIPAVCRMPSVNVRCMPFLKFIGDCGVSFA